MATAEEDGSVASAYGGGGAGGMFRKKPMRSQTMFDSPLTALRVSNINNTDNNSSWLKKMIVEPTSKLISYGADRFFDSVLRRRLPPPPQTQPQAFDRALPPSLSCSRKLNGMATAEEGGATTSAHGGGGAGGKFRKKPVRRQLRPYDRPPTALRVSNINNTGNNSSWLKKLVVEPASKRISYGVDRFFGSVLCRRLLPLLQIQPQEVHADVSEADHGEDLDVLEDSIAIPVELAKDYMRSRSSKVLPSELGMRGQLGREEARVLTNLPIASKSPVMSLTKKSSMSLGAPKNGFVTHRSRSRSAIYNMARTPYSRVHPASVLKRSGSNFNGYAGPSTSSHLPPVENNEKLDPQPTTLKRRSSVFDDEVFSVGSMRRIRQKSNLLAPRFHHTAQRVGVGPHSKQRLELMGDRRNDSTLKNIVENETQNIPSTSYARVPSRSSEVAAKILQQLEKLSPKKKSSESKFVATREKWPIKSATGVLSGQAHRSRDRTTAS